MSDPSHSRVGYEPSVTKRSQASRTNAEARRRVAARTDQDRANQDQQVRVKDPDDPNVDRTPQPLLKPGPGKTGIAKRGIAAGVSTATGATDRRASKDGASVAGRDSVSIHESTSRIDESVDTDWTDDDSAMRLEDSTSDSHSTLTTGMEPSRMGGESRMTRRTSGYSSSLMDGTSVAESSAPPRSHAAADAAPTLPRHIQRAAPAKEWTPEQVRQWRQGEVVISLVDTPVNFLFQRQDELIPNDDSEEAQHARVANERYEGYKVARSGGETAGRYTERGVSTLNPPMFVGKTEIQPVATRSQGNIQVSTWKLHDEMLRTVEEDQEQEEGEKVAQQEDEAGAAADGDGDGDAEAEGGGGEGGPAAASTGRKKANAWMHAASLLENVMIAERCVVMNNYESQQLAYRGLTMEGLTDMMSIEALKAQMNTTTPSTDAARRRPRDWNAPASAADDQREQQQQQQAQRQEAEGPPLSSPEAAAATAPSAKMKILWRYRSEVTKGRNVSCMSWNKENPDVLAAGYGEYGVPGLDGSTSSSGLICCWSVKNPLAPERVIQLRSGAGVSTVHFSRQNPSLLAVGSTDGTLALYDVRGHGNNPALKTSVGTGQHTGTVWEVKWVDRGRDRGESLVSISADGHVMEWSIKKGLERTNDLMKLKRVPARSGDGAPTYANAAANKQNKEALLARQSGGMCFDMNPKEPITYVVGTEDGTLHKCSKSQNENYLLDYKAHSEPVYRVRWAPYCPDYFVTASADWTSRLYHVDTTEPVATYDANKQDPVQDVSWSHTRSTVFATATGQGQVDVWDIGDPNQPRATLGLDKALNCVGFAEQESPLLTAGDTEGDVYVVKLCGEEFERNGRTEKDQEDAFRAAVSKVAVA